MSNRTTKILRSAAALCAVMAVGGTVRAADGASAAEPKALDLKPVYLQEAASEAAPRKPLMDLLDRIGLADSLDAAGVTVGGHVEGSWTYNADTPGSHTNFGRSFDVDDQDPTLNQIDLFAEKAVTATGDKFDWGGRVEWIWGGDSRFIHSLGLFDHVGAYNVPSADDADSPDEQFDLNQAYLDLALPVGTGLKLRVGKFVTPMGYEVINPTGNLLYSHGYLFNFAIPLTHTGVMGTYNLSDKTAISAGVTRGWDTSLEDDNDTTSYLVTFSTALSEETKFFANVISGPDQFDDNGNWRTVIDLIVSTTVGDNVTLALNGDYGYERNSHTSVSGSDAQWYGLAGYASVAMCKEASLNVRAEYFNDEDGARVSAGVGGAQFAEGTVGLALRPFAKDNLWSNLVIRPEVRWDWSDENVFDDGGDNNQFTAAVDAYFTF
jgi:hypothetical protein